ncbi:hypothetical protein RD792_009423 [Penstemon davidsonii]|uniref:Ribosome-recycling factor, chloroplastic n=1 Tax=Penstemon davidsonii TaxID=160366 RepID=A0ABR0D0F0_9LAMI|nr:hypothetical protein RD792_009423 [Penstemon davidsonii]
MAFSGFCKGAVHKVGDSDGWTITGIVNYNKWASSNTFQVGDTLRHCQGRQRVDIRVPRSIVPASSPIQAPHVLAGPEASPAMALAPSPLPNSGESHLRFDIGLFLCKISECEFMEFVFKLRQASVFRKGVLRCASVEDIEKEKAAIEKDVKERMEKTIENVRTSFNSIRTGRASPAMLDKIEVEYYGTPVSLKSIAQISTPESSSLLVQPYDKSSLKAIEKAIVNSDLGMTPNNDGDVIRLTLPQLTSDRRKELSKVVAKQAEEGKVAIRNIRRDAIKSYEKLEKVKKSSSPSLLLYKETCSNVNLHRAGEKGL